MVYPPRLSGVGELHLSWWGAIIAVLGGHTLQGSLFYSGTSEDARLV